MNNVSVAMVNIFLRTRFLFLFLQVINPSTNQNAFYGLYGLSPKWHIYGDAPGVWEVAESVLVSIFSVGPDFLQEAVIQVGTNNIYVRVVTGMKTKYS